MKYLHLFFWIILFTVIVITISAKKEGVVTGDRHSSMSSFERSSKS